MICPRCGRNNPDGIQCPCGAPLLSSNPAVNLVKTVGSSPKYLTAVILFSVGVLFSILSSLGANAVISELYYYGANMGLDSDVFYPMMNFLEGSSLAGAVLSAIPSILIAVGMWLFYVSCRDAQTGNVSTIGLTICKVMSYISLVLLCLLALLLVVVMILVIVGIGAMGQGYYYVDHDQFIAAQVILSVIMVMALAVLALEVAYQICVIKVINRIKATALNGVPDNRIPVFLTGFMMVQGVLSALGGLAALFGSPLAGLGALASAVCVILMSMVLGEYRRKMTMLLYPPVQPMYNNMPPYAPVPPQQPGGPNGNNPPQ